MFERGKGYERGLCPLSVGLLSVKKRVNYGISNG
jgi:hypothetical protein